ncbi:MAG: PEP-CTERM sorting domain-containing protein [Phycisphaerales bacterium]
MKIAIALAAACGLATVASAQVGFVDFDGTELGLTGYTNSTIGSYTGTGLGTNANQNTTGTATTAYGAGDTFWPMTRAVVGPNNVGMGFNLSDDSVSAAAGNTVFATDTLGFAGQAFDQNGFFGVTDTVNGVGSDTETATFTFNITGATGLGIAVDLVAMGDFESADIFTFDYSIDGSPFANIWTITANEAISQNYLMDSGTLVTLDDPAEVNGSGLLDDNLQTFAAAISGTGSSLTIRFSGITDGSEGFGFDNLTITPAPATLALVGLGGLVAGRRRR